ncbi:hypothetical protein CCOS865_04134 [Pseudomonas reidholzensis]|uniref:Uncharacterized protein n=1 Tax=Pseudomonas reidholzensis TaxID=1785162 RepID=A0A383RYY5_9PSED|nr:hypothetical protein CCOS865_04134 [Pseudomonas reidholzensis]
MNDCHQLATDPATLIRRINEYTPDDVTVQACCADKVFTPHSYENLTFLELCPDDFRSKALLNLGDNVW